MCKVSLITTVYNEEEGIERFLLSYKEQTKHADEFVIVDGGSSDATAKIINSFTASHPSLNIILVIDDTCNRRAVAGPIAKGRNVAIEHASNEYIAVTDAGCTLDREWFAEITKPFDSPEVDVVSGWYEAVQGNQFQKDYAEAIMPKLEKIDPNSFLPSSRSIAFKKSCWLKAGKYPTKTYTAEDTLFDINLKKAGCKFFFAHKAKVYWDCPQDYSVMIKKQIAYGYGDGQLRLNIMPTVKQAVVVLCPLLFFILRPNTEFKHILLKYSVFASNFYGYMRGLLGK